MSGRTYTVLEAAERVGVVERTIRHWIVHPQDPLPVQRGGPSIKILEEDLLNYASARGYPKPGQKRPLVEIAALREELQIMTGRRNELAERYQHEHQQRLTLVGEKAVLEADLEQAEKHIAELETELAALRATGPGT